jgi:hypothetical protein
MIAVLLAALLAAAAFAEPQPSVTDADEPRQSTTRHYPTGGRSKSHLATTTEDSYGKLVTSGPRNRPGAAKENGKPSTSTLQSSSNDFWIYFADVELFYDDDHDGYYYGIDLLFDADTYFEVADVYAVLYLSLEGGPWNEYAATGTFSIFGATSDDEYVVVTELESGYPTGSYDLLIELYDAFDGAFLTSLGPIDTSELAYLPLEDFRRDDPRFDAPIGHSHGGGAMDFWSFGTLALYLLAIRLARRHPRVAAACPWNKAAYAEPGAGTPRACLAVRMTLRPQTDRVSK